MSNINRIIKQYIKMNLFKILLILVFFVLGIIVSIIYSNFLNINIKTDLINYMQVFNTNILNGEYSLNYINIILNVIKNNLVFTIAIVLLGSSVILSKLIYVLFAYKGFIIGFCLSISIMLLGNIKGTIYGIIFLFLPNILFIIFEIVISIMWIDFSNNIIKNKSLYNIRKQIWKKTIISIIIASIMTIIMIPIQILINTNIDSFLKIL